MNNPTFLKQGHSTPTRLWRRNRQNVPKHQHIKFKRWEITQKKAYNKSNKDFDRNEYISLSSKPAPLYLAKTKVLAPTW